MLTWESILWNNYNYLGNIPTLDLLGSTTLASAAASINFTGLPATYTDLMVVGSVKSASTATGFINDSLHVQFNGVTAGNYQFAQIFNNGSSSPGVGFSTNQTSANVGSMWNSFTPNTPGAGNFWFWIPNYAGTTFYKNFETVSYASDGTSAAALNITCGCLGSTVAAVSSMSFFFLSGSNLTAKSFISVYGF
jgi:hypothetical protein